MNKVQEACAQACYQAAPTLDGQLCVEAIRALKFEEVEPVWYHRVDRHGVNHFTAPDEDCGYGAKPLFAAPQSAHPMDEAIRAGDGTLHGAIDYWQRKCAEQSALLDECKDWFMGEWNVVVASQLIRKLKNRKEGA